MILHPIATLQANLVKIVIGLVIISGITVTAYFKGRSDVYALWNAEIARQDAIAKDLKTSQTAVTKTAEVVHEEKAKVIRIKGDTIYKRVKVYVTPKDDANCVVPDGFVRVWNSSNRNTVP
jgi:hypothetical protein